MTIRHFYGASILALALCLFGCSSQTYKGDKLKEAIVQICAKENGIQNVDVKVVGTTIGVYLPLQKLFSADFKNALLAGKVKDVQALLEPSAEAIEKVEDVLFAISRVLLSTERKIDFYELQAVDVEKTGMSLMLLGNVDDIRRVRVWDISRDEYRRRIIHELKANRTARWHQPVRQFFDDLNRLSINDVRKAYFGENLPVDALKGLFFFQVQDGANSPHPQWDVLDLRSIPAQKNQVLVYARVKSHGGNIKANYPSELQYLFLLGVSEEKVVILRIIPFQYLDANGAPQKVPFPKELGIQDNLDKWDEEFMVKAVDMGEFIAEQTSRRIQAILAQDERMQNTFREVKVDLAYDKDKKPAIYRLNIAATLSDFNNYPSQSILFHEDMLYFLNLVIKEFNTVTHAYHFDAFSGLELKLAQEPKIWSLDKSELESFRKGKVKIRDLFESSKT